MFLRRPRRVYKVMKPDDNYTHFVLHFYDGLQWYDNFRITKRTFQYLHDFLYDRLVGKDTNLKKAVPVSTKILCSLMILADGAY